MTKQFITICLWLLTITMSAADQFVTFTKTDASICLSSQHGDIKYDTNDYKGVLIAIDNLKSDLQKVIGRNDVPITIGTLGKSKLIDKKSFGKDLKGKNEKFVIRITESGITIAGSDKRGTIYGIYELSRQMGVSPWYWWADVPVQKQSEVYAKIGSYTDGEPAVKYRGIFLNDEWPALGGWSQEKFGGFNSKMYAHVFELVLRLKGNFMWPAMWNSAFYADDPLNLGLADDMGVMMGTSHHEPMGRAQQEWTRVKTRGAWNYDTNRQELVDFWRGGVERLKDTEDVVTIGMRGNGDEPMGEHADVNLLERIVEHQRKLITEATGKKASEVPQVWALYKEVQEYYEKGMRVPEDVILLLCDDNWGNVRILPAQGKNKDEGMAPHKGGYGMYYHVDYVGGPRSYRWINVSQIQRIWEQMLLSYQKGVDRLWILNVGDLKPMEFPIDFWFKMAWDPNQFAPNDADADGKTSLMAYTEQFCAEQFGADQAKEAARILNLQGKYVHRVTPEILSPRTYSLETGEWDRVMSDYKRLESDAFNQYLKIGDEYKDAYNELVLFPVRGMANMYELNYSYAMNEMLAAKGDIAANEWAVRARQCYDRDSVLNYEYNHNIADGKWNHMMDQTHIGYRSWNEPRQRYFPTPKYVDANATPSYIYKEEGGVLSIEAQHYAEKQDAAECKWTTIDDFGKTLSAIGLLPYTASPEGASVTYKFKTDKVGEYTLYLYLAPTFPYNKRGLEMTYSVDGKAGTRFVTNKMKGDQNYDWENNRINIQQVKINVEKTSDDLHTLTFAPHDAGIVIEKIVVDFGGKKRTYLGELESPIVK